MVRQAAERHTQCLALIAMMTTTHLKNPTLMKASFQEQQESCSGDFCFFLPLQILICKNALTTLWRTQQKHLLHGDVLLAHCQYFSTPYALHSACGHDGMPCTGGRINFACPSDLMTFVT